MGRVAAPADALELRLYGGPRAAGTVTVGKSLAVPNSIVAPVGKALVLPYEVDRPVRRIAPVRRPVGVLTLAVAVSPGGAPVGVLTLAVAVSPGGAVVALVHPAD
jgi:hypothetical protein